MPPHPHYTLPALREAAGAVLLKVKAAPGSSREGVAGVHGDALKVSVSAPPERGKANLAVGRVLAGLFGLRQTQVRIHSGPGSRDKWFHLEGISRARAMEILHRALDVSERRPAAEGSLRDKTQEPGREGR